MQVQDNLLSSIKQYCDRILAATDIPVEEHRALFKILVTELLQRPSTDVLMAKEVRLSESEILKMLQGIKGLRAGIPIQYIIGHTDFYGLRLACDARALIPRPETEELLRWVLGSASKVSHILDIGTGSGCIALALKSELPTAVISAMDYSSDALALAQKNSIALNLQLQFIHENILKPQISEARYDIIVSNPPYVRELEKAEMIARVLEHEPHMALFVPDEDPVLFYRAIADYALRGLHPGGQLFFEINEYLGVATTELLRVKGYEQVEIKQDLYGKDRMVRAVKNG